MGSADCDRKVSGDDGYEDEGEEGESVARSRALSVEAPRRERKEEGAWGVVGVTAVEAVVGAARDVVRGGMWMGWRGGRVARGDIVVVVVGCGWGGEGGWSCCFCSVDAMAGLKHSIILSISEFISSSREAVDGAGTGGRLGKVGVGRCGR